MIRPIDRLGGGPHYQEVKTAKGWTITVTPPAWAGGGPGATVQLTADQYRRYRQWKETGILIQNALPELTADQREILMTGLDDKRFKEYVGDPKD